MPEWYENTPDVGEVAKKEFGNLIEDDPEWKVVGTIADEGVIAEWADDMPIKLQQSKSITLSPGSGWTYTGVAELKESWAKEMYSQWTTITVAGGGSWDTAEPGSWMLPGYSMSIEPNHAGGGIVGYPDEYYTAPVKYSYGSLGAPEQTPPQPHQCHCYRDRHLEPLTQKVADMLSRHSFDPNYDPTCDDSPIVCVGSETYGPNRATGSVPIPVSNIWGPTWTEMMAGDAHYQINAAQKAIIKNVDDEILKGLLKDENLKITYKAYPGNEEQE